MLRELHQRKQESPNPNPNPDPDTNPDPDPNPNPNPDTNPNRNPNPKQELEFELRQYGETARKGRSDERQAGMVPQDTRLSVTYTASRKDGCVYLVLRTNNETRIKAAATFAERLFEGAPPTWT